MVGCVIAKGARVIGEGYHKRFGGHHAEIEALRACTKSPQGATAYVTLEPCCHVAKTPPCTDALIKAGIGRVVAAVRDPNPQVDGGGARQLAEAGISVEMGLCSKEAADLLAPYLTRERLDRPMVIAKWAQSLDGKLATRTGPCPVDLMRNISAIRSSRTGTSRRRHGRRRNRTPRRSHAQRPRRTDSPGGDARRARREARHSPFEQIGRNRRGTYQPSLPPTQGRRTQPPKPNGWLATASK